MKINVSHSRLFLLAIPLAIYGTELLFSYALMKRNIFPPEYISWRVTILLTFVWISGFALYLCENAEKWPVLFMKLFSPVAGYILVACVGTLDAFVPLGTKTFPDNYVTFFWPGFFWSYIIPLVLGFFSRNFLNLLGMWKGKDTNICGLFVRIGFYVTAAFILVCSRKLQFPM